MGLDQLGGLIGSMNDRCQAVIDAKRMNTKY